MTEIDAPIRAALERSGFAYEVLDCDPELADTAVFCAHYGYAPEESANTILVKSKTGAEQFVVCVLLATTRLDVNKAVRGRRSRGAFQERPGRHEQSARDRGVRQRTDFVSGRDRPRRAWHLQCRNRYRDPDRLG